MDIAKQQINGLFRGVADVLVRTMPTLLVILGISSKAFGLGLADVASAISDSQPVAPLIELLFGK